MKKFFVAALLIAATFTTRAQAPSKMSYQSIVRNNAGQLVANGPVSVRITVLQGSANGAITYMETHSKTSNENGLVTLEIGGGSVLLGTFSSINWASGPYFLKTETDPAGGSNYSISATSQLLSVPYALYAEKSGNSGDWMKHNDGIYYSSNRVAIGTTPNSVVPLTINDNNPSGNGNAVLHLKSNDTWHTAMTMFNGSLPNSKYYSFIIAGPSNSNAAQGTFGLFNHNVGNWTYSVNPTNNNVAFGSTGFNANSAKSKVHVYNGDVNIEQIGSGIIMKSPNGACWRVTVNNAGEFVSSSITCP